MRFEKKNRKITEKAGMLNEKDKKILESIYFSFSDNCNFHCISFNDNCYLECKDTTFFANFKIILEEFLKINRHST